MEDRQSQNLRVSHHYENGGERTRSLSRANESNIRNSGSVMRPSRIELSQSNDRLGSRSASGFRNPSSADGVRSIRASSVATARGHNEHSNGDFNKENEIRYRSSSRNDFRQSTSSYRPGDATTTSRPSRTDLANLQSRHEPEQRETDPGPRLSRRDLSESKYERQSESQPRNLSTAQRESRSNLRNSQFELPSEYEPPARESLQRSRQDLRGTQSRHEPDHSQPKPSSSRALSRHDLRTSHAEVHPMDRSSSYNLAKLPSSHSGNMEVVVNSTKFIHGNGVEATHAASEVLQDITSTIPQQRSSSGPRRSSAKSRGSRQKKYQDEEDAAREELVKNLFMGTGLIQDETKEENNRNGQLKSLLTWNEIQERFRQKVKEDELNATKDRTRDEFEWELLATKGKGTMIPRYQPKGRPFRPTFQDPVSLYHWYQREWAFFRNRIPGEATHSEVRWNIRQKFLDPQPIVRHTRRAMALRPKNDRQPYLTFMGCDFTRS